MDEDYYRRLGMEYALERTSLYSWKLISLFIAGIIIALIEMIIAYVHTTHYMYSGNFSLSGLLLFEQDSLAQKGQEMLLPSKAQAQQNVLKDVLFRNLLLVHLPSVYLCHS